MAISRLSDMLPRDYSVDESVVKSGVSFDTINLDKDLPWDIGKLEELCNSLKKAEGSRSMGITRNLYSIPDNYRCIPPLIYEGAPEPEAPEDDLLASDDLFVNKPLYHGRDYSLTELVEIMLSWKFPPLPIGQAYLCGTDLTERGQGLLVSSLFCDQLITLTFGQCLEGICNCYNDMTRTYSGHFKIRDAARSIGITVNDFSRLNCYVCNLHALMSKDELERVSDSMNTIEFCLKLLSSILIREDSSLEEDGSVLISEEFYESVTEAVYQIGRCLQVLGNRYLAPITSRENIFVYQVLFGKGVLNPLTEIVPLVTGDWWESKSLSEERGD